MQCILSSCVYATRKLQKLQSPVGDCNFEAFCTGFKNLISLIHHHPVGRHHFHLIFSSAHCDMIPRSRGFYAENLVRPEKCQTIQPDQPAFKIKKLQNYSPRLGTVIFEALSLRKRNSMRYTTKQQFQEKEKNIQYCFSDDKT